MYEDKKTITYVTSKVIKDDAVKICNRICDELPIIINRAEHINDIFPLFSNPSSRLDFIVIDIEDLSSNEKINRFDIIRTLFTLINCTVYRDSTDIKPKKRNTKIVALIADTTTKQTLKEVLSMPEISFLSVRHGGKVNYELIKKCVENYINDGEREPKFIMNLFKDSKTKIKREDIPLTTRQRQVFDIVTTHGSSNKHIAKILSISESTVKLHVGALLKKYGLRNRTQLAVFAKDI